ncbi:MAG: enoyl-CoA hydratase/isomerase family protein [Syntrophales bacterium]|jgi:enoyl-CoA hydratase/carnithine racemase|nr:enoyl-CoA hydratase/isomerase family protein [Syntrophales bacterium]MCK9528330.1 enoyl-CoA hydratase/isomerase family protein [Syntrophales bacterium]MDX9922169.1 enoyl-CoA hydratase/isomerase family protein [Syntrophales bacterium]
MYSNYNTIIVSREDGFATVTLNRPRELNALSREMQLELIDCFTRMEDDNTVRAVIVTGGDYVFSAGMDLKEIAPRPDNDGNNDNYILFTVKYLQKIYTFKRPVIAAVGGIALGGGFNLATVCDMIIASETAIFGHPELKFGLNPLFDPLSRFVGAAKAKEITMLGEPMGAKEAHRIGLVNKVLPPEMFMEEARAMARELAQRPERAIEAVKKLSDIVHRLDKKTALEHEVEISALLYNLKESREQMQRFLEELAAKKKKQNQS